MTDSNEVWFQLVNGQGQALASLMSVDLPGSAFVSRFLRAVSPMLSSRLPAGIDAFDLKVFANRAARDGRTPLNVSASLGDVGNNPNDPLLLEEPTIWFQLVNRQGQAESSLMSVDLPTSALASRFLGEASPMLASCLPAGLSLFDLRVFADRAARDGRTPLNVSASLGDVGKKAADPLILEIPRIWFQLLDAAAGAPYEDTTVASVALSDSVSVERVRDVIIEQVSQSLSAKITAPLVKIFANCDAKFPLALHESIGSNGSDVMWPLAVKVSSKRARHGEVGRLDFTAQMQPLEVSVEDIQGIFAMLERRDPPPFAATPSLHAFWTSYGGFPSVYAVRQEEIMFWKAVKETLPEVISGSIIENDEVKRRLVMVGSPGVGKSCMLMLLGFYLAVMHHQKVLIIRKVKTATNSTIMVYLDGTTNQCFRFNKLLSPSDIFAFRKEKENESVLLLLDGYVQEDLRSRYELIPFHFLATSCQYDRKHNDPSLMVLLPAWRKDDLMEYARNTDWAASVGLQGNLTELVSTQYYYSGGSLREFCKTRADLVHTIDMDVRPVERNQAYELVNAFGGENSQGQVDRLRRHYVADRADAQHYMIQSNWTASVDSGYVLKKLSRILSLDKQLEVYRFARTIEGSFLGIAFEQYLHTAVRRSKHTAVKLLTIKNPDASCQRLEMENVFVQCNGNCESECNDAVSRMPANTYWHPDYPNYPFIDAIVMCDAVYRDRDENETREPVVALIQVTIQDHKTFNLARWNDLQERLNANPAFSQLRRVFVVVGPDATKCKAFSLYRDPDLEAFSLMVCCFDPNLFIESLQRVLPTTT